jgi:hypothetical protein
MCEFVHLKRNSGNLEEQDKLDSVWSNPDKSGHPLQKKTVHKGRHGIEKMKGKMPSKTPRFRLAVAPFFNHNGVKKGLLPHY